MIRIKGPIPITIHPIFWVTAAMIGYFQSESLVGTLVWMAIIVVSVLFHELGHALTAYTFGKRARIELVALGGVTIHDRGHLSFPKQFLIVLNGPLFGFILFLGAHFVLQVPKIAALSIAPIIYAFKVVNLYWTILNLLPVFPMDGGQILRIILEAILGVRGVLIALMIGTVSGALLGLTCFAFGEIFLGALFFFLGFSSFQAWKENKQLSPEDNNSELKVILEKAEQQLISGQLQEAEASLLNIVEKTKDGVLHTTSAQMLAQIYRRQKLFHKVLELLLPLKADLSPPGVLTLHEALLMEQQFQEAALLDTAAYEAAPLAEVALGNSYAHAMLGHIEASLGWMQTAIDAGLDNAHECLQSAFFDPIRTSPEFTNFHSRIQTG